MHLCRTRAFEQALRKFKGPATDVKKALDPLKLTTGFHRMLVARDLAALVDTFPVDGAARAVYVGGGASGTVRQCAGKDYVEKKTYPQEGLLMDLKRLHKDLVASHLDMAIVRLVCPRDWQIDLTEHAGCEKRRYEDAKKAAAAGKKPRRSRKAAGAVDRQKVRCQRLRACWERLGFPSLPSAAK